jgi:DNA helicase-2/ATP-dependent DNA helicase PcrA
MDLSVLNAPQREAVRTTEGPLLVLAGAGSGKTRVITHRIGWLLEKKRVPAKSILAVTFTNKAASEMRQRAIELAGPRAKDVTLCTFHAFGAEVMREHASKLGFPKRFAIADMGDQISIIKRAMRERNVDDRAFDARKVLAIISRHKNARTEPQPLPEGMGDDYDLVSHLVFPLYQLALKAQGAVDFDDLILLPSVLFEKHPKVRAAYTDRFRYVMVDEYQDTNAAQLDLLIHLSGTAKNVCVVGDDDQCIYSWRGAEVRNILDFDRRFPGAKEVRLEQNYRSSQVILDAANAVIEKNPDRKAKRMWTDRLGGALIQSVAAPDENEEARYVAHQIHKAIALGTTPDEIAVLYRTNGQSRPIEEALRERQVDYEIVGGQEFFDKREVKDVIAYFKVLANPRDEVSLLRIVNVPSRGIGDVTLERLTTHAHETGKPLWDTFKDAANVPDLPRGAPEKVVEFCSLMERYRAQFRRGNLGQVTRALLKEIDFAAAARASTASAQAADRKVRAVDDLIASLDAFEQRNGTRAGLMDYLHRLSLDTREEEEEHQKAAQVTLMTLHGAKGLEWKLVFLIGMEEDLLPHSGMQGEPPNPEEERRLCYVGITRARERLVLTRAANRAKRGKLHPRTPSRFLSDLPEPLVDALDLVGPTDGAPTGEEKKFFSGLREKLKPPPKPGKGGAEDAANGLGTDGAGAPAEPSMREEAPPLAEASVAAQSPPAAGLPAPDPSHAASASSPAPPSQTGGAGMSSTAPLPAANAHDASAAVRAESAVSASPPSAPPAPVPSGALSSASSAAAAWASSAVPADATAASAAPRAIRFGAATTDAEPTTSAPAPVPSGGAAQPPAPRVVLRFNNSSTPPAADAPPPSAAAPAAAPPRVVLKFATSDSAQPAAPPPKPAPTVRTIAFGPPVPAPGKPESGS